MLKVNGAGELLILHAPKSLQFEGSEPLDESLLREVYSGALGFSVSKGSKWEGLKVLDPFHYPEAVVGIVVDGVPSLGISKGSHFPLITNQNEEATWHALNQRVSMRFPDQSSVLTRLDTVEGNSSAALSIKINVIAMKLVGGMNNLRDLLTRCSKRGTR
uniref:Renin receptor N-terminal domain-containing protein n=1 Tax=Timema genevievae TaxID=629358 RepID=A0A7R9JUX2_TIMGE|nr:unnamed protein product [Timema genevievae]